jgi:hypothetical protein
MEVLLIRCSAVRRIAEEIGTTPVRWQASYINGGAKSNLDNENDPRMAYMLVA